jgi:hypothetical protein
VPAEGYFRRPRGRMDPSAEPSTVADDLVAALGRELAVLRVDHQMKLDSVEEKIRALERGKDVVAATDVKQEVSELRLRLDSLSTENAGLKERTQALEVKKEKKRKRQQEHGEEESTFQVAATEELEVGDKKQAHPFTLESRFYNRFRFSGA